MSDDQGWGDAGYQGHPVLRTPALDAMAANGVRLDRFYAQSPLCSPTRMSALTGRHPYRAGVWTASAQGNYRAEEVTLAEVLQPLGYRTGMFGKWHFRSPLAEDDPDAERFTAESVSWAAPWDGSVREDNVVVPWEEGFDTAFVAFKVVPTYDPLITPDYYDVGYLKGRAPGSPWGRPYFEKLPGSDYRVIEEGLDGPNARIIVDAAERFIREAASGDAPFLAYVWFNTPHRPIVAGPAHRARFDQLSEDEQHWYGAMAAMDDEIGRLRALLRELNIEGETIVWFASDNGPSRCGGKADRCLGTTGGLKGHKGKLWEGGVRVPGLVEWPGVLEAGSSVTTPISTSDYYPTVLALLGVGDDGHDNVIDGVDAFPFVTGRVSDRTSPIFFRDEDEFALIEGDWKMIGEGAGPVQLYNLADDPAETADLAARHPTRVAAMKARFDAWEEDWKADLLTR